MAILQKSDMTGVFMFTATVDIASGGTDSATDTTITAADVRSTDLILAIPPATLNAGIAVQGCHTIADGSFKLRTTNASAGTIDPASATWTFLVFRR